MKPIELYNIDKFSLKSIRRYQFKFSDEYQRSDVWKKSNKQKLIDSILCKYPIGVMTFRKLGKKYFEVIDGQQRIKTIQDFLSNGCKWSISKSKSLPSDLWNKSYKEIKSSDYGTDFDAYKIWYMWVPDSLDDDQVCTIFTRLQEGLPLNTAEKLNAIKGPVRELIFRLKDSPVFKKTLIKEYRFGYRELLAHILLMEIKFLEKNDLNEFPSLRYKDLEKMYYTPSSGDAQIKRSEQNIKKTLYFINKSFPASAKFIENKGDFLQIYLLASSLRGYPASKKLIRVFGTFVREFLSKSLALKDRIDTIKESEIEKDPIKQYALLRSGGQTRENLRNKFQILNHELFKKLQNFRVMTKDAKRDFNLGQKIYIFYVKNKEICSYCRKRVRWHDAEFHHKIFHSKGGPTSIKNCSLMHKLCHMEFHKNRPDEKEAYFSD